MSYYGANQRPVEITFKIRPANRPDLTQYVAEYVADFCQRHGITEQMIQDIRMSQPTHSSDAHGSYSQIHVRFIYF